LRYRDRGALGAGTPWDFMYAPVIVDEWTTARPGPFGTTQADIY
jgi:hypothetical protein